MDGSLSRTSNNSNMSGAAAIRAALEFGSTRVSTEATGWPLRSITRDHFCGSMRHMPEITLVLAIAPPPPEGFPSSPLILSLIVGCWAALSRSLKFMRGNGRDSLYVVDSSSPRDDGSDR